MYFLDYVSRRNWSLVTLYFSVGWWEYWMMIDDWCLRPVLCTRQIKWADWPPKLMKREQRGNTAQICPRRDSNSGGSEICSKALPTRPRRRPDEDYRSVWINIQKLNNNIIIRLQKPTIMYPNRNFNTTYISTNILSILNLCSNKRFFEV